MAESRRLWATALLLLAVGAVQAVPVRDDRGITREFAQPPRRIVSLLPSLTETVCALQACDRLVGVDDYSDWPPPVRALPRMGGLEDARVETIVSLQPDLVLVPTSSRALQRLEGLGLPVVALEPRTLGDVQRVLRVLGPVLAAGDADVVWTRLVQGMDTAARNVPPAQRGVRVYFEVGNAPWAASAGSFIGELLLRLGATNVVPAQLGPFPKLNPEFVVRADPQVIFIGRDDALDLRSRPGWQRVSALRHGRVCAMTPEQGNVLMRAGPRVAEAAALLARCLQGRWNHER